ncbi:MAG: hypothetical protein MUO58_05650 [Anaerolineales bacterium]|nr:hypothetical protein [Anaerolineales bacterium]
MKPLSKRQQEFLSKLLDLYYQEKGPIHYSTVAKRLGVGNVTAYEMMRLLEDRGLAQAEYQRPDDMQGPGRSSVVFRPTPLASKVILGLAKGRWSDEDWEGAKDRILEQLRLGEASDYEVLLNELLDRLPNQRSPTLYLMQMVTAIALGVHSLKKVADINGMRNILRKVGLPGELDLNTLAGISVGFSLVERFNRLVADKFLTQAKKYQSILSELSEENHRRLAEFTREVLDIVGI